MKWQHADVDSNNQRLVSRLELRELIIQRRNRVLLRIEAVGGIQMEANFGAVAGVNSTEQL